MDGILEKLNLGSCIHKFAEEKITPDIVCRLSAHDLEVLGLHGRADMMRLRAECIKFGGEVRDSIHGVDSEGVEGRKRGRLHRRVYNVQCPNALWHVDTNHKLVRRNFVIFGCVDGFSRLCVALKCLNNNKANT